MTKSEIRAQIAERKKTFQSLEKQTGGDSASFQCLEKLSVAVLEKFQTLEIFRTAKAIGTYMPLPDEVNVLPLFEYGSAGGVALPENSKSRGRANSPSEPQKHFFIPAFDEAAASYRMAKYTPELKKGKFGIPEPENPVWAGPDELDLILVPGVAFDRFGNRLGRGGGFYDRLLPQYRAMRVAICFSFQCLPVLSDEGVEVEKIPSEPHDCRMDFLATDSEILKFAMNG